MLCRILIWHGKVAMAETWKVQAGTSWTGISHIFIPNTETHPQLRETKRDEKVHHYQPSEHRFSDSPVTQHVPDEEISLYLLQSGYRVEELIRHMVCWK